MGSKLPLRPAEERGLVQIEKGVAGVSGQTTQSARPVPPPPPPPKK